MLSKWLSVFGLEKIPEEYQEYAAMATSKKLLKKPLENVRFVIVDCETTGLDPTKDKLLSVAAVAVEDYSLQVTQCVDLRIQQHLQTAGAVEIHEITPNEAAKGLAPHEAAKQLLAFIGDGVIIGQHIAFDIAVINQLFEKELGVKLHNRYYDISNLVKRIDNNFSEGNFKAEELSLDKLCARYSVPIYDRHTALGDCLTTALLFMKLLARLQQRKVATLKDLLKR